MPDREFVLKPLSRDAVRSAYAKVERYRLLNEPEAAESICRDILRVDPTNHDAQIALILCLTDQFPQGLTNRVTDAWDRAESLEGEYFQLYAKGIICERRAKAHYQQNTPHCGSLAHSWFVKAMDFFERAGDKRVEGNDSAVLRWNTCARFIRDHADIVPSDAEDHAPPAMLE